MTASPGSLNIYLFLFSISQDVRGSLSPLDWSLVPRFALPLLLLLLRCISISHPPPADRVQRQTTKQKSSLLLAETAFQSMTPEIRFPVRHMPRLHPRSPQQIHRPSQLSASPIYLSGLSLQNTPRLLEPEFYISSTHHPRR